MGTLHFKSQLIVGTSVILASVVAASLGLYILVGKIDGNISQIGKSEALINQSANSLSVVAALKQQAVQAANYQTAMNQLLPTQDGLISFNQWVSNIADQYQVTASVAFQGSGGAASTPQQLAPDLGEMPFSLSASGSPSNIASFLNDIESKASGFLLSLTSFDLINSNGTYQLTAQGVVFFQQP